MATIKFYGTFESLKKWREIVKKLTGQKPSIQEEATFGLTRHFFQVELTTDQRNHLQEKYWHKETGNGLCWNECLSYCEV